MILGIRQSPIPKHLSLFILIYLPIIIFQITILVSQILFIYWKKKKTKIKQKKYIKKLKNGKRNFKTSSPIKNTTDNKKFTIFNTINSKVEQDFFLIKHSQKKYHFIEQY